jgi:methylase of polypeptide subunit release factors
MARPRVIVTNDDGIDAPGIDALVTALSTLPDVELTIVAPAENQSGTSMNLTDGEVVASDAATSSGVAATAVVGFPADSVRWALENLDVDFDLVVSNPPYVETGSIAGLDPEVRDYDPHLALDGGPDGLGAYRELAARRRSWLGPEGLMVVEIGASQAHGVRLVFEAEGARMVALHRDYGGRDRAMVIADALV